VRRAPESLAPETDCNADSFPELQATASTFAPSPTRRCTIASPRSPSAPVRLGVIIGLNDSAGTGFELLAPVSLIAGASRFVRQDVYCSRLPRSIRNRNQCASLVSLTLACAAESKSMPIVVSLSGSTGTRPKRNFHRPESNCGIALNSSCRAFIVFQSQLPLRIQWPRQSTGSVPQTRKKCSNLSC
jgi:hypothetical protein